MKHVLILHGITEPATIGIFLVIFFFCNTEHINTQVILSILKQIFTFKIK